MKKSNSGLVVNSLYRIIMTMLVACICLFCFRGLVGIGEAHVSQVLAILFIIAVATGMTYFNLRGRIILFFAVAGGLTIAIMVTGMDKTLIFVDNYIKWLMNSPGWSEEWIKAYWILQAGIIALFSYFFEALTERYAIIRKVVGTTLLVWLLYCLFFKQAISHGGAILSIAYILITYIEWIQGYWIKTKSKGIKDYILWIMPFLAVYFIVLCVSPSPAEPFDWKFVKDAYKNISETFTLISQNIFRGNFEDFGTFSGFSEDGSLLGSLRSSNEEVMKVRGQVGLMTNVYLTGKVFDEFDGRGWVQTNKSTDQDRFLDTLETAYAVERYNGSCLRNYIYSATIKVKYEYFNTGYLFAPLKTFNVLTRSNGMSYSEAGDNLLLNKKRGYGSEYDVQYYQMNVDHPEFYRFLESNLEDDEEAWLKIRGRFKYRDKKSVDFEDLLKHRENVYENNLQEMHVSDEVKAYLAEITEGCDTDIEKLKAIEKTLSEYTYNQKIGKLPQSVQSSEDFLDYMLLEKREGYCTYFATAFILLAWEEGIPARYVQGFCIPISKNKERAVTSSMAHAWPEVYIEGVGWIPFEPTPGYAEIRYTPWEMKEGTDSEDALLQGAGTGQHYWEEENVPEQPVDLSALEEMKKRNSENYKRIWAVLGYTVLFVLLVSCIMIFIDGMVGKHRYKQKTPLGKYKIQVNRCLRILTMLGYERNSEETLQELKERVDIPKENLSFIKCYEELLYGKKEVTQELFQEIAGNREQLLKQLKQKKKYTFIVCRTMLYLMRYR